MIKLENVVLPSPEQMAFVIQGLRNPFNSWDMSDSVIDLDRFAPYFILGDNDLTLMKKLSKAGADHRKYMRMIPIMVRITAPLYWVAEHDTYKVATVRNSCSFMHKGVSKPFELDDFSYSVENTEYMQAIIDNLNQLRDKYLSTKDDTDFIAIRQMLPSGYNVTYNWCSNYETLANIYHSRKGHKLDEWQQFCEWIETLPYSEIIVGAKQ